MDDAESEEAEDESSSSHGENMSSDGDATGSDESHVDGVEGQEDIEMIGRPQNFELSGIANLLVFPPNVEYEDDEARGIFMMDCPVMSPRIVILAPIMKSWKNRVS